MDLIEARSWIFVALPYLSAIGLFAGLIVAVLSLFMRNRYLKNQAQLLEGEKALMLLIHDDETEREFDQKLKNFEKIVSAKLKNIAADEQSKESLNQLKEVIPAFINDLERFHSKARLIKSRVSVSDEPVFANVRRYTEERETMFANELAMLKELLAKIERELSADETKSS